VAAAAVPGAGAAEEEEAAVRAAALLRAELPADVHADRIAGAVLRGVPMNRDRWTPPGYYVPTESWDRATLEGVASPRCAHCGTLPFDHIGPAQYCPVLPSEVRA
jgi:hypothetical protein